MSRRFVSVIGLTVALTLLVVYKIILNRKVTNSVEGKVYSQPEDFANFNNVSGSPGGCFIVPNYVHFLRLSQPEFSFVDAVCVLAAFKNQRPDLIFIHTDEPALRGKYWTILLQTEGLKERLRVEYILPKAAIFGQKFSKSFTNFHRGDIARLEILIKYGGIFLDNDSYIVRSLDDFRRYEMAIGWKEGGNISNQVIIAHKHSRMLQEWMNSYKGAYKPDQWYYNAGIRPTQQILLKYPFLVHRVKHLLAAYEIFYKLFMQRWKGWREHYAIHLMVRHQYLLKNISKVATYPVAFNEDNIKLYPITFQDMVNDVYPMT